MHHPIRLLLAAHFIALPLSAQDLAQEDFFEKRIRPILADKCQTCHNSTLKTAGLDLSISEGFMRGGQSGPIVSSEASEKSRLLQVIGYQGPIKMPPGGKLGEEEIALLTDWVESGAPWPGTEVAAVVRDDSRPGGFTEEERRFWSFQKVQKPWLPEVKNEAWVRSPIDRFILARLQKEGLRPAPPADKATLLRRTTYDLTGLPPSEKEISDFLADDSPKAFEAVVDRLLASPRYGEHWGRHWLDVARYADSTGNDEDHRYPYAWRYRDYVIDAFNQDLSYDQFLREQVAGDLLPPEEPGSINRPGIVATGFLALGPKAIAQQDKMRMLYDVYDEQLDVVSKSFLGLTVTCARCHDHKFDPILTKDYYSMLGIFASTRSFTRVGNHVSRLLFTPLVAAEEYQRYTDHKERISNKKLEVDDVVDQELERYNSMVSPRLAEYMLAAHPLSGEKGGGAKSAPEKRLEQAILEKWRAYLKPRAVQRPHLKEWREAAKKDREETARAYQTRFQGRLEEWSKVLEEWRIKVRRMLKEMNMPPPPKPEFEAGSDRFFHEVYFEEGGPFRLSESEQEKVFSTESRQQLTGLRAELKQLEESLPPEPDMACAVEDGEPVQQKVLLRGDYNNPGEEAPKAFPAILEKGEPPPAWKGSGRLQLAHWLTRPDHPLTSRVMVNRIWQWHFGEGLVRTPNNFGKLGARPTHPALLDYLAFRFVEEGWSIKKMHRLIMHSSVYGMSSEARTEPGDKKRADPENKLLSHFSRRRLQVEEIRDGLLAIDGSLDLTMGGTLQSGFGTDGENSSKRLSLNPETIDRRMVYLPLRRANLPTLLNLFDFGDAVMSMGKRASTNVAPQALFMMNSEFVAQRARNLASSLMGEKSDEARRVQRAYLITLNRSAQEEELQAGVSYVRGFREEFSNSATDLDAWYSFCRILMGSNDFIYVD